MWQNNRMDSFDLVLQKVWANDTFAGIKDSIVRKTSPIDQEGVAPGKLE